MGCRLPKLRKAEERRSPGNIYSTLRRPQVETKVGVAYTYHFLDFLLGSASQVSVSSVLCLSSVRELPVQVRELYAQGFVLVAVHPFVHPCGPRHAHIQRQLHRAVLVRETQSPEKSQLRWARNRLETEVCVASQQAADPEAIQNYVKKIQDVAEQGVMFVGFLQQPGGGPYFLGHWDPEELSSFTDTSPTEPNPNGEDADLCCCESQESDYGAMESVKQDQNSSASRKPNFSLLKHPVNSLHNPEELCDQIITSQIGAKDFNKPHNHIKPKAHRMQLFALYNHTEEPDTSLRFYSLRVPLHVQKEAEAITDVDANWLDHMTQHFSSGAQLIDGFFHLTDDHDSGVSSVDSIFIFQSSAEETTDTSYDAIVVEQWTVIDGVVVKTDYIPLLQSLAPYGWRLMCVLPTPIVRTNSDGSLSTKQILFLQRPILQRRRK
uniref:Raftlin, lipid raft linker 1a n=1 Tax=Poecilia formosa TaxID=48698 RepID=A0A087XBP6_POEFO